MVEEKGIVSIESYKSVVNKFEPVEQVVTNWNYLSTRGGVFTIPTGDVELGNRLSMVVANIQYVKTYYKDKFNPTSAEPQFPYCYSYDAKSPDKSVLHPVHSVCLSCPKNMFGSSDYGKGKACQDRIILAGLLSTEAGELLNTKVVLSIPPTSLKNFQSYLFKLNNSPLIINGQKIHSSIPIGIVITIVELTKDKNVTYSVMKFSCVMNKDKYPYILSPDKGTIIVGLQQEAKKLMHFNPNGITSDGKKSS